MKHILIVSSHPEYCREYMMPWYSEFYVFKTEKEAQELHDKLLLTGEYEDDQLYIVKSK